ncbi:hypothetical protein [Streptomyces sp. NPDC057695]|uniref:DUF7224 domain-containing protein n=1 Tax=Streptomyces sp. NPDC057695 TaxID=3346217 RepID=UPI00369DF3D0
MRLMTLLRTSSAARAAILLIPWLVSYSAQISQWVTTGYWESVAAQSSFLLGFTVPACAACAAWEGARIRRSGILASTPVRSPLAIALSVVIPVLVLGLIAVLLPLLMLLPYAQGIPGGATFAIVGLELLLVTAHSFLGYAAGFVLPRLLAAPAVLMATWLWMAYPAALEPFWLRQLNGHNLNECCSLDQVVADRAVVAPALVAGGLLLAALIWIRGRRFAARALAPVVVALGLTAGAVIGMPLGYKAGSPRAASELTCDSGTPAICLWPEQMQEATAIRSLSSRAAERLAQLDVPVAPQLTMPSVQPRADQIIASVALSAIPGAPPRCAESGPWPGNVAQGPLMAWLVQTAGADARFVQGSYTSEDVRTVEQVRSLPEADQTRWFRTNAATLKNCVERPALNPDRTSADSSRETP